MSWYRGDGRRGEITPELPGSLLHAHVSPAGYLADQGLIDAVNVALHIGQPLLLAGKPGTGKTQLAYSLAWELRLEPVLKFETKSTSEARDLFYAYDALGRFHEINVGSGAEGTGGDPDAILNHITWNALGLAILHANEPRAVADIYPSGHPGKRRSVVLIDEIDKAPRDFPNDLLNEVEHMYFKVPELRHRRIEADRDLWPLLVLTSNSEKNLSEAFLRRCVFYNIPFPDPDRLRAIVHRRLGEQALGGGRRLDDALDLFHRLRDRSTGLLKKPSTGELLAWLQVLKRWLPAGGEIRDSRLLEPTLSALIKTVEDRDKARKLIEAWIRSTQT